MGIPKFYRWISERYPLISQSITDGTIIPEYDNLYLDFNGIIHRCSHPDNINPLEEQLTESDMILKMFEYVQNIVQQIKPSQVLIIAVDGVAPRAKMNQQRSRRFRSAQEITESLEKARKQGKNVPDQESLFDSNCITPGTEFMEKLNSHFEYFIRKKINEDETWKNLNVLFSGHDVPGEGEHKIMSYIRKMKSQSSSGGEEYDQTFKSFRERIHGVRAKEFLWNPNATHCFYGLDADLIMLSLVTHEPHFSLLRENALKQSKPEDLKSLEDKRSKSSKNSGKQETFQLLHISILREYLNEEFSDSLNEESSFTYDLERIIDDFVFMCYFIGNDFLPNLPFLDISDEALNKMFLMYKDNLHSFGDYLTSHGNINPTPCARFMEHVSVIEKEVLGITSFSGETEPETSKKAFKEMQSRLETLGLSQLDVEEQRKLFQDLNPDESWKQGYYLQKFKCSVENESFHETLRFDYMQGLAWVLKYYYNGCQSWGWFYPYHYAPLASDLVGFKQYQEIEQFPPTKPFEPFQQLLGVLPIASKRLLPIEYQKLMTGNKSPLKSYYPLDFSIDLNGKKNDWEAVVLIPFIDADVLRKACETIDPTKLSDAEKRRNRLNCNCTWYYYDEDFLGTLNATLPGIQSLKNLHTRKETLLLPEYETNFTLTDGVLMGTDAPSHFPTMKSLEFTSRLKYAKISIFRGPSRKETLVITPTCKPLWIIPKEPFSDMNSDEDCFITDEGITEQEVLYQQELELERVQAMKITQKLGKELIGKVVFSNWPYHEESRVIEICCQHLIVRKDKVLKPDFKWDKIEKGLASEFLKRRGIELGKLQLLVRVEPIAGMRRSAKGALYKDFNSGASYWQPYQVLLTDIKNKDSRYRERKAQTIEEMFPLGSPVAIKNKKYCGSVGKITGHKGKNECEVKFTELPELPNFPQKLRHTLSTETFALHQLAKHVNCSNRVISQVTGEIWCNNRKVNIGLSLKYSSRNEKVIGYSERKNNQWFFTQKALDLIIEYKTLFPEVFQALEDSNNNANETQFNPKTLFPNVKDSNQKFQELKKWIYSLHLSSMSRVSALVDTMSPEAAEKIETKFQALCKRIQGTNDLRTEFVERKFLQGPMFGLMMAQHSSDDLSVGDFVCYVRSSSGPSFGSLAIVMATNEDRSLVSLLFGEEFIGGNDLDGLCSSYRCLKDVETRYCLKLPCKSFNQTFGRNSTGKPSGAPLFGRNSSEISQSNQGSPTSKQQITILSKSTQETGKSNSSAAQGNLLGSTPAENKARQKVKVTTAGPNTTKTYEQSSKNRKQTKNHQKVSSAPKSQVKDKPKASFQSTSNLGSANHDVSQKTKAEQDQTNTKQRKINLLASPDNFVPSQTHNVQAQNIPSGMRPMAVHPMQFPPGYPMQPMPGQQIPQHMMPMGIPMHPGMYAPQGTLPPIQDVSSIEKLLQNLPKVDKPTLLSPDDIQKSIPSQVPLGNDSYYPQGHFVGYPHPQAPPHYLPGYQSGIPYQPVMYHPGAFTPNAAVIPPNNNVHSQTDGTQTKSTEGKK